MNKWSTSSQNKLNECDPNIIIFANEVLRVHDCSVIWGYRDEDTQNEFFHAKKSTKKFPYSKHNRYPSDAIDLAPYVPALGGITWDTEYSLYFCGLALGIADQLYFNNKIEYPIRAGVNWSTNRQQNFKTNKFRDTYHFEIYRG